MMKPNCSKYDVRRTLVLPSVLLATLQPACGQSGGASASKTTAASLPTASVAALTSASLPQVKPFALHYYKAPSGKSDYAATLGPNTCAGADTALQVKKQVFSYGDVFTACYDFDTGALTAAARSTQRPSEGSGLRPAFNETIVMPLTNDHYFDYVNRLKEVMLTVSVLGQVEAADALQSVLTGLEASPTIDALLLANTDIDSATSTLTLSFNMQLSTARNLIVRFGDAQQVYDLQTVALKATDKEITVKVAKPAGLDFRDSASVQAYLAPIGSGSDAALSTQTLAVPYLSTEAVKFWPLNTAVTLHVAQANPLVVQWLSPKERTLILRLQDAAGQTVKEQRVDLPVSAPSSADTASRVEIAFDLSAALPLGEHYSLLGHLVPKGGVWSDEIASYATTGIIRVSH